MKLICSPARAAFSRAPSIASPKYPYHIFTCRNTDIPLNQHGAHAAERINNLRILFQIWCCQFHNQCRKGRVHGSGNCMFPVRKPVIRNSIKFQCREKLSLTICNQSKFYLIIPRRIHQFSIRQLFNGRSKLLTNRLLCSSVIADLHSIRKRMACPPGGILHRLQALASTPSLLLFRFLLQKSFDRK